MSDELGAARGLAGAALALGRGPAASPLELRRPHRPFCEDVAAHFEHAPRHDLSREVADHYRRHVEENLVQYRAAREAGIEVRPWTRPGQPYAGSRELIGSVRRTGVLHVFLTRDGHGPDEGGEQPGHPLRTGSGVVEQGVELTHNDLLRVVHDLYGHVLHGTGFDVRGELAASHAHSRLYSGRARRVLFTEQVGQICWYFHGPHRNAAGIKAQERRYPIQKVFLYPTRYLAGLTRLFEE